MSSGKQVLTLSSTKFTIVTSPTMRAEEDKKYSGRMASSDQWQMSRAFRALTLLEEAGGDEKLETRFQSSEAMETKSLSASAEKKQGGRSLHDWNVAVSCLFGGTIWLVANRPQAVRKHGSCLCWSGRSSSLPNHCYCDWTGRRANPALQV